MGLCGLRRPVRDRFDIEQFRWKVRSIEHFIQSNQPMNCYRISAQLLVIGFGIMGSSLWKPSTTRVVQGPTEKIIPAVVFLVDVPLYIVATCILFSLISFLLSLSGLKNGQHFLPISKLESAPHDFFSQVVS